MTRSNFARYAVPVVSVGVVLIVKVPLETWVGSGPPLILFIPALTFSAWFGGMGPGLLATALSVVLCNYLYFPPIGSFLVEAGYDRVQLGVFLVEGVLTSVLMRQLIVAQRQSEASAAETEAYRDTLQQSEARLQAILDHSTALIYLKDAERRYLIANRHWESTFGIDRAQAVGKTDAELFPRPVAEMFQAQDRQIQQAAAATEWEDVLPVKGDARTYLTIKFPLLDANGALYAIGGFSTDITDRKRAEEAVRRERDFAESLILAAQAIVLVLDREGRVLQFNPYFEHVTGHHPEGNRAPCWFVAFVPPDDRSVADAAIERALARPEGSQVIHRIIAKGGRLREIEWAHRMLPGSSHEVLTIGHDITELKEAQQRALQAERLAAIGQMVTGLAHESRNALQRSQACLEMLVRRVGDRPAALDLITGIQEAQDDLHRLYEEVRNYAAPIQLDRRECDLRDVLHESWGHLEPHWRGRDVRLWEHGLRSLSCEADRFRIGQVFRNILDNALAACQDPVQIDIDWSEARFDGESAVRVVVRDNGPGLTPEEQCNLFEPFFTTKTQGTGLGMAIAKRIVEAHGGGITVDASEGPGGRIVITLPKRKA
jgi:PAS domain S-box-containing protein